MHLRVLVVSLDRLTRAGLAAVLDQQPGLTAEGQVSGDEDGSCPLTSYRVMEVLYRRYDETQGVLDDVRATFLLDDESLDLLQLRYFLYTHNVFIKPEYRELLYSV